VESGIAVLRVLAEQHEIDTKEKRAPTNFSYIPAARIEEKLGISNDALRRRVERLRDKIDAAFLGYLERTVDRQLVVESGQWQGYRLNPQIRLIALDELSKR
jgi:biotin operon repressor